MYWIGKPNISSTLLRLLYHHDDCPSYQAATSRLPFKLYFLNNPFQKKKGGHARQDYICSDFYPSLKSTVLDAPAALYSILAPACFPVKMAQFPSKPFQKSHYGAIPAENGPVPTRVYFFFTSPLNKKGANKVKNFWNRYLPFSENFFIPDTSSVAGGL